MDNNYLAELLFGDIKTTPEDMFAKYPARTLPDKAAVTRFAPSPTGFMHIGGLYAALISMCMARQSDGTEYALTKVRRQTERPKRAATDRTDRV